MSEYDFELKFQLADQEAAEEYLDALFEAGCDDAVVGVGKQGFIGLDFSREAPTALGAVSSAIRDVRAAIPHARLVEVGPDLVGLSDLGGFFNVSRQYMRKLIVQSPGAPLPVYSGSTDIWRFLDVVDWLSVSVANNHINNVLIGDSLRELADVTMQLNLAKEAIRGVMRHYGGSENLWSDEYYDAVRNELSPRYRDLLGKDDIRDIA
jgi:hypothetical protein